MRKLNARKIIDNSVINGGWQNIAPYGTTMAGLPSQIAYVGWKKNIPCHSTMAVP